ncbi:chitinase [Advenella kashmirensis W13003]|uniref:Chitinase n=2 Tax=Advenella kashmirensis TaxID=310575 RepID=V8QMZ9_9BURK|nr:chitinase [Advenella kashmirensis W13003]
MSKNEFQRAAGISAALADKWYEPVVTAFGEYIPYTGLRMAHFLAQVGHESMGFARTTENLNYSAEALYSDKRKYFPTMALAQQYARKPVAIANRVYANRMGNGPEGSGDGWKYRGHGLIQITGKNNTAVASEALGIPVDRMLELLENDPDTAARASAWWLWSHGAIKWMDQDNVLALSKLINTGSATSDITPYGLDDRKARLSRAKAVLC